MRLRFTARASRNLASIAAYIANDNPAAAARVGPRIRSACELLMNFPEMGRPGVRPNTREISLPGLPYIIVYRLARDQLVILGVYHERQLRPGQTEL
jgi:toxin ParE1/3/4